jgi:CBS domain-containing protein
MTRDVIHASSGTTIRELVALMGFHHVKRIPILRNGVLVGIVSRHDLMKAAWTKADTVAAGDGALRLAVETRLKSELGLGTDFEVQVNGSVVTITGQITSEAQRDAIRVVAESIEGARAVVAGRNSRKVL